MAEIKITRLRYVITSNENDLMLALESLGFKVEIKSITSPASGKGVACHFVLPENPSIVWPKNGGRGIDLRGT